MKLHGAGKEYGDNYQHQVDCALVHDDLHVETKETQQQTAIIIKRALEAAKTITQD
jgi:hypothetical protein